MEEDTVELMDYLEVIWKWKWLICLVIFMLGLFTAIRVYTTPRTYAGQAILKVGKIAAADKEYLLDDTESIKHTLLSEPFIDQVIDKAKLKDDNPGITPQKFISSGNITVRTDRNLVTYTVKAKTPKKVVEIEKIIAKTIIDDHKGKFNETIKINKILEIETETQIKTIEKDLIDMRATIKKIESNPGVNAPAVILLQGNLTDKEHRLTELKESLKLIQINNSSLMSYNTKLLDEPVLPREPISRRSLQKLIISVIVGIVISVIFAFFFEYIKKSKEKKKTI